MVKGRTPYVDKLAYYDDYQQPGTPWLDGGYTVIGETVAGWDTVERIQAAERDANDRPIKDRRILSMEIVE